MQQRSYDRRSRSAGFTAIELLTILTCTAFIFALMLPAARATVLASDGANGEADNTFWPSVNLRMRDARQLKGIHQGWIIFAGDHDGIMLLPGNLRRHPIEFQGDKRRIPGRGDPDPTHNTTANLYSASIMHNLFDVEHVVSPWERNSNVSVRENFNYNKFSPINAMYWDDAFKADLAIESNVSYAHLLLHGERIKREWRNSMNPAFPVLGNRGPKDGKGDPDSYTCDDNGNWQGNLVFNDNHTRWETTMTPREVTIKKDGEQKPDNVFAIDDGMSGRDVILTFMLKYDADDGPTIQHD